MVVARVIAIVAFVNWLFAPLWWLTGVLPRDVSLFIAVFPLFPLLALSNWLRKRAVGAKQAPDRLDK
jgi:hypothetical protein